MRRPYVPAILGILLLLAPSSCKKEKPPAPPPAASPEIRGEVKVKRDGKWLFIHATEDGRFETVETIDDIPASARGVVRVMNPEAAPKGSRDPDEVLVVDATRLAAQGEVAALPVTRTVFETRALAMLPPGESSALSDAPRDMDSEADAGAALPVPSGKADLIVYGTAWCGACRSARRFLVDKGIPFVDKDVERDKSAARELQDKAEKAGIAADRVPILDVRGRLLIGFDPARVQRLLGVTP